MLAIYRNSMLAIGKLVPRKLQPLWKHPAGPQTIFFWAPTFKWCLVGAGVADYTRPAEKLSLPQSCSLMVTGLIWSRYSIVIEPINWNLFSVNFMLGVTAIYQVVKIIRYQQSIKNTKSDD
ncbi:Mitochondrial pyruvate carrier 2 [Intoshia linei]|uniref:Mitochondrial pyruvate carrier n=1 Tax=Intoshia linei TaxID=1819745 RepID=A0A177AU80_9BILA|nr:Mitochondrial pyruvate carrier 2 [Intoshia linei]